MRRLIVGIAMALAVAWLAYLVALPIADGYAAFEVVARLEFPDLAPALALLALCALCIFWPERSGAIVADAPVARGSALHGTGGLGGDADVRDLTWRPKPKGGFAIRIVRRDAPVPLPDILEPGAALVGTHGRAAIVLPRTLAVRHGYVLGPTGGGKTRGFFLPNCLLNRAGSFVATDPKGELWARTSGAHERAWRFAPSQPDASLPFNPIPLCRDETVARLAATAALQYGNDRLEQKYWVNNELTLCAALFAHAAHSDVPTLATVYNLLEARDLIARLAGSPSRAARRAALHLGDIPRDHFASCRTGVAGKLDWLNRSPIRRFTSATTAPIDFARLREHPTAVYLCLNEEDMTVLPGLIGLFWTILLHQLINSSGPVPITLLLDEFANIGTIPNFARLHAVARGRDIAIWLGLQSVGQLDEHYGRETARTIRDNSVTKIALAGLENDSAEEISRALGEGTALVTRATRTPEGWLNTRVSYSDHEVARRVLTADEVRRLPDNELLMISANRRPLRLCRVTYGWSPNPAATSALGDEQALSIAGSAPAPSTPPALRALPDLPHPPVRPARTKRKATQRSASQDEG